MKLILGLSNERPKDAESEPTTKKSWAMQDFIKKKVDLSHALLFGDGKATQQTLDIIKKNFGT